MLLAMVIATSCSQGPDAAEHLMPELGSVAIAQESYSAHAECRLSHPKAVESAMAIVSDGTGSRELAASLSGDLLCVDIDRLQSDSRYSLQFVISAGEYSTSSDAREFTTAPGPKAIYPEDMNFETYLLEHHDLNRDGVLTTDEARRITSIDTRTDKIRSMDEIRYMPNLFYLDIWNSDDAPGMLTHLDVSGNPNLIRLNCDWNSIEALDLTNNPYLEGLFCAQNSLSEIDLSHNPELKDFNFDNNLLTSIDISHQTKLTSLNINANRTIRSISVPNPEILINFTIGDTHITEFDLSTMPALEVYGGNNLHIGFFPDLTGHPHMKEIHLCCEGGAFMLDDPEYFTQFEELEGLNICGYKLDHVDFSKNTRLHALWISIANELEELDLSASPYLELVEFNDCEKLKRIYVHPDVVIENLHTLRGSCKAEILHKD